MAVKLAIQIFKTACNAPDESDKFWSMNLWSSAFTCTSLGTGDSPFKKEPPSLPIASPIENFRPERISRCMARFRSLSRSLFFRCDITFSQKIFRLRFINA
ncbi:MAG: hypothetical protein AB4368_16425 [Xenococcaceae cyanobacterium]